MADMYEDGTYLANNDGWHIADSPWKAQHIRQLITRNHLDYAPRTLAFKAIWEWITDPIGFVMTRKMLLGIKQRAEQSS